MQKIKKESFDLKKEEDAEDGGKSDEEENGEGESDPFKGSLRDCKREHSSLVWVDGNMQCFRYFELQIHLLFRILFPDIKQINLKTSPHKSKHISDVCHF